MGKGQKQGSGPPKSRGPVPSLNLDKIASAKPIPRQDGRSTGSQGGPSKNGAPPTSARSQAFSPPSAGMHLRPPRVNTPESARGKRPPMPTIPAGAIQRPGSADSGPGLLSRSISAESAGASGRGPMSSGGDRMEPMMTPRGSYRDILCTPRGTNRLDPAAAAHRAAAHAAATAKHQQLKAQHAQQAAHRSTVISPTHPPRAQAPPPSPPPAASAPATAPAPAAPAAAAPPSPQVDQRRTLEAQTGRASHEVDHVRQQISTIEGAIAAQQATLVDHIAAVQALGVRRDRLASDVAALQAAAARAKAAAAARQAEIDELEVLADGLKATLAVARAREEGGPGGATGSAAAAATARLALLQVMQAAAAALRLPPGVAAALDAEASVGGSARRSLAGTSATARSEISTSRFETPSATVREPEEERAGPAPAPAAPAPHADDAASSSSGSPSSSDDEDDDADSLDSSGTAVDEVPPPRPATATAAAGSAGKLLRPGVKLPPLQLPQDKIPAVQSPTGAEAPPGVPPAAMARLQAIRSKLEVAEAILTARVPENGVIE